MLGTTFIEPDERNDFNTSILEGKVLEEERGFLENMINFRKKIQEDGM